MRADWTASGVPVARPRAPKGRNGTGLWWRRYDEYTKS